MCLDVSMSVDLRRAVVETMLAKVVAALQDNGFASAGPQGCKTCLFKSAMLLYIGIARTWQENFVSRENFLHHPLHRALLRAMFFTPWGQSRNRNLLHVRWFRVDAADAAIDAADAKGREILYGSSAWAKPWLWMKMLLIKKMMAMHVQMCKFAVKTGWCSLVYATRTFFPATCAYFL